MTTGFLDRLFFGGQGGTLAQSNVGQYAQYMGMQNANALRPYRHSMLDALREAKSMLYEANCQAKEQCHPLAEDIRRTLDDAEAIWLEAKWIDEQEQLQLDAALTAEYGPEIKP